MPDTAIADFMSDAPEAPDLHSFMGVEKPKDNLLSRAARAAAPVVEAATKHFQVQGTLQHLAAYRAQQFVNNPSGGDTIGEENSDPRYYGTGKLHPLHEDEATQRAQQYGPEEAGKYKKFVEQRKGPGRQAEQALAAQVIRYHHPDLPEGKEHEYAKQFWPSVEKHYMQAKLQESIKENEQPGTLAKATYWLKRAAFGGAAVTYLEKKRLKESWERINDGSATGEDFNFIGSAMAAAKREQEQGRGGKILDAVSHLPGLGLEFLTGGAIFRALAGSTAAGSRLLATAASSGPRAYAATGAVAAGAVPFMSAPYVRAMEANSAAGRDPLDLRGFPAAFLHETATNAVMGALGKTLHGLFPGTGAAKIVERAGTQAVAAPFIQAATDVVTNSLRLETGWGTVGKLLSGKKDEALTDFIIQALSGATFSLAHEPFYRAPAKQNLPSAPGAPGPQAQPGAGPQPGPQPGAGAAPGAQPPPGGPQAGPKPGPQPGPSPGSQGPHPVMVAAAAWLKHAWGMGMRKQDAVDMGRDLFKQVNDAQARNPNLTPEQARAMFAHMKPGPLRDMAFAIADAVQPKGTSQTSQPPPQGKGWSPPPAQEAGVEAPPEPPGAAPGGPQTAPAPGEAPSAAQEGQKPPAEQAQAAPGDQKRLPGPGPQDSVWTARQQDAHKRNRARDEAFLGLGDEARANAIADWEAGYKRSGMSPDALRNQIKKAIAKGQTWEQFRDETFGDQDYQYPHQEGARRGLAPLLWADESAKVGKSGETIPLRGSLQQLPAPSTHGSPPAAPPQAAQPSGPNAPVMGSLADLQAHVENHPDLTPKERTLLSQRAQGLSQADIAKKHGVSREAIRQRESKALAKIGAPLSMDKWMADITDATPVASNTTGVKSSAEGMVESTITREESEPRIQALVDAGEAQSAPEAHAMVNDLVQRLVASGADPHKEAALARYDDLVARYGVKPVGKIIEELSGVHEELAALKAAKPLPPEDVAAARVDLAAAIKERDHAKRIAERSAGLKASLRQRIRDTLRETPESIEAATAPQAGQEPPKEVGGAEAPPGDSQAAGDKLTPEAEQKIATDNPVWGFVKDFINKEAGWTTPSQALAFLALPFQGFYQGAKMLGGLLNKYLIDGIKKIFAPYSRGPDAAKGARIIGAHNAEKIRQMEIAEVALTAATGWYDKLLGRTPESIMQRQVVGRGQELTDQLNEAMKTTPWQQLPPAMKAVVDKFLYMTDILQGTGQPIATVPYKPIRDILQTIRDITDACSHELVNRGILPAFNQDYFGNCWQHQGADTMPLEALENIARAKNPLGGYQGFTRQRKYSDYRDGLNAGLTPLDWNPVRLALYKISEMRKAIMKHDIVKDIEAAFGQDVPEPVGRLLLNYLSPGLGSDPLTHQKGLFNIVRTAQNTIMQTVMGISAFHATFLSIDGITSHAALGAQYLVRGQPIEAAKQMARGPGLVAGGAVLGGAVGGPLGALLGGIAGNVTSNAIRAVQGFKGIQAYMKSPSGAAASAEVEALIQGGMRAKMDRALKTGGIKALRSAIDQIVAGEPVGLPKAALQVLPAIADFIASPIMDHLVPLLKMSAKMEMMRYEAQKIGPTATVDQRREAAARVDASVDNRMGQLNYDNLHWNKAVKDVLMLVFPTVGWNVGTPREVVGGVADVPSSVKGIATGKGMSHRTAYSMMLFPVMSMLGGILYYFFNGKSPENIKDTLVVPTGTLLPDGTPQTVMLPGYHKDVMHVLTRANEGPLQVGRNLGEMVRGKLHPSITAPLEALFNKDYRGAAVYDPDSDTKTKDVVSHILGAFRPISVQQFTQQRSHGADIGTSLRGAAGVVEAPRYLRKTDKELRDEETTKRHELTPLQKRKMGIRQAEDDALPPDQHPSTDVRQFRSKMESLMDQYQSAREDAARVGLKLPMPPALRSVGHLAQNINTLERLFHHPDTSTARRVEIREQQARIARSALQRLTPSPR